MSGKPLDNVHSYTDLWKICSEMSSTHAVMEILNKTQWEFTTVWDYRPILIGALLTMTSNGHSENFITSK